MKYLRSSFPVFIALLCALSACQSNATDEDIQQDINDEFAKDHAGAALHATVDKGVATITGECSGDSCSARIVERVKKIKGVKDVDTHIIETH